jgi:DNA-binding NtrC family response regulator
MGKALITRHTILGHSLEGQAQNLLNKGALGFVPKPYKVSELATAVAEALRNRRSARML